MADSNQTFQIIGIIVILAIVAFGIYYYMNMTNKKNDSDQNQMMAMMKQQMAKQVADIQMNMKQDKDGQMSDPIMAKRTMTQAPSGEGSLVGENQMEHFANSDQMSQRDESSFPKSQLTSAELLPQDNSSQWAQVYPTGEGSLKDRNFLQAGYHIGINTVGQTLRNANQQLRSEPPNPQVKVSPWLQSTIEPDMGRKPFEIGGCA
jgi:hypothetical protein